MVLVRVLDAGISQMDQTVLRMNGLMQNSLLAQHRPEPQLLRTINGQHYRGDYMEKMKFTQQATSNQITQLRISMFWWFRR